MKSSPWIPAIVIDQREKLAFGFDGLTSPGHGVRMEHLPTGDYSLHGCEREISIERKSLADLYQTLGRNRQRFERELDRLSRIPHAFVVTECTLGTICTEPPPRSQFLPKAAYRSILAFMIRYPTIHWIPCDSRRLAEITTYRLLERHWKTRNERRIEQPAGIEQPIFCADDSHELNRPPTDADFLTSHKD